MITLNDKLKIAKAIYNDAALTESDPIFVHYIDGMCVGWFDPIKYPIQIGTMILWLLDLGKFTHFDTGWIEFSVGDRGSIKICSFDYDNVAENLMTLTLKVIDIIE